MLNYNIRDTIEAYLEEALDSSERNIYFEQFHSSKSLTPERVSDLLANKLSCEISSEPDELEGGAIITRVKKAPLIFWELSGDRWLIVYSSSLDRRVRDRLSNLSKKCSWILDVWVPSEIVNELYHENSPKHEDVNIERKWDPYYIYQRTSDIPDNLLEYYNENINEFVEQEIEFNLKTPQWMVDQALKEGVQEDLLEKSEIEWSRFTYTADEELRQDGGVLSQPESTVTVRGGGQVVHRSGTIDATYDLLSTIDSKNDLLSKFDSIVPEHSFEEKKEGIVTPKSFREGSVLKITFEKKEYNEEASIKLSNLLTVGQADVKIHGVIKDRGDLWFLTNSYMTYDGSEFEILFTSEEDPPFQNEYRKHASLYVRPISGTTAGLVYLYHKLKEKFDSRTDYEIVEQVPIAEVA
jgi:hypothetical protein